MPFTSGGLGLNLAQITGCYRVLKTVIICTRVNEALMSNAVLARLRLVKKDKVNYLQTRLPFKVNFKFLSF